MADVPFVETFPNNIPKSEIEKERQFKLTLPGVKSSTITKDNDNWILTTVFQGDDNANRVNMLPTDTSPPRVDILKAALRVALRLQEIGDSSPYKLSFAGKGKSGATFGFMQGDMSAGGAVVQDAFRGALTAAGIPGGQISNMARRLSVHLID